MNHSDLEDVSTRLQAAVAKLETAEYQRALGEILAVIAESNAVLAKSNGHLAEACRSLSSSVSVWTRQARKVQHALFGLTCVLALGALLQAMNVIKTWLESG